jgi:hypothetical protein
MSGAGAISRTRSPLSHAAGEEGGIIPLTFPLGPLPLPRCGRGRGDERSRGDLTNQITPLPQCGRGAGGEGARSAGEGPGVRVRCACTSGYTRGDMVSSCPIRQLLRHQMIVHCIPSIDEFHLLGREAMISDRLLQDAGQRPALPGYAESAIAYDQKLKTLARI